MSAEPLNAAARKAYDAALAAIENNAKGLQGADWFEYLEELSSHIESMIDCYKEENPEEFK